MEEINQQDVLVGRSSPRSNYDRSFIKQLVSQVQAGQSLSVVARAYGVKVKTLEHWYYNSSSYALNKRAITPQMKRSVIRAVEDGRMTLQEAAAACGNKTVPTIRRWIANQKQENDELAIDQQDMAKKKTTKKDTGAQPSMQDIAALQQALADEKLKNAALNTLIDVAEEKLKISIRKKPGARQS